MSLIVNHISKSFQQGQQTIPVLRDFSLAAPTGQSLALVGPSGSGKSTLLSLIAGLDSPDSGEILIDSYDIAKMNESERTLFRRENLGIIFQQFHLLPYLTAKENIMLPLEIAGDAKAEEKAEAMLALVGLEGRANHFSYQMSGGEIQRVAFARAFVVQPKLLLADEPSGSLDSENGKQVIDLLFELTRKQQTTLILVTHNEEVAQRADAIYRFEIRKNSVK
jgi:putative ABC transport system ATP-binding protein